MERAKSAGVAGLHHMGRVVELLITNNVIELPKPDPKDQVDLSDIPF
jgi:hypothetical protein